MPNQEDLETTEEVLDPKDNEIQASSPARDGELESALRPSSTDEFVTAVTSDLGPPSTMGRVDDDDESGENYGLPFGD
jgi:hypothetical protein